MFSPTQEGMSMIEVLISIFVLSLGVLGVAGMQLNALRTTQQSGFQTAALHLAAELADQMRANDVQMRTDDIENPFLSIDFSATDDAPNEPAALCHSRDCGAAELAAFDIYDWTRRISEALPGARARVCRDQAPWDGNAGAWRWECDPGGSDGAPIVIKIGWLGKGRNPDGSATTNAATDFPPSVALTVTPYTR